jgi:hypothetical protein
MVCLDERGYGGTKESFTKHLPLLVLRMWLSMPVGLLLPSLLPINYGSTPLIQSYKNHLLQVKLNTVPFSSFMYSKSLNLNPIGGSLLYTLSELVVRFSMAI